MSRDDDATDLVKWAISNGCIFNSLQLSSHSEYGGYALYNTSTTLGSINDKQRVALFIPNSLIISLEIVSSEADESQELADILNQLPQIPTLEPILTIFLLYQLSLHRNNIRNKWSTYINYLPKSSLLPITWSNEELHFLSQSASSFSRAIPGKLTFHKSIYEVLCGTGWFRSISWEDYVLAESWVSSRTIENPNTKEPLLVPILDMSNHSRVRNAAWEITNEGIELRREPFDIPSGNEICISYGLERGSGESLYRYGFLEDASLFCVSKGMTLFDVTSHPRIPGGNVFRLSLSSVRDLFRDLSFLSYENWYVVLIFVDYRVNILPVYEDDTSSVHAICPPTENHPDFRMAVQVAESNVEVFDTPDLEALVKALNYGDTYPHARNRALKGLKNVILDYREKLWEPDQEGDGEYLDLVGTESYSQVRKEVWDLVKLCCIQEGRLLDAALQVLHQEIHHICQN
jgi:hypothetical protein